MAPEVREVIQGFTTKLGAEMDRSGGHIYFYLEHGGSQYTVGKLSHSWTGDLNDTQVNMLAKKLFLRKREFEDFIGCELSTEATINLWQQRRSGR